jgi:ABC-2 type transport system ATP-binding protein
MIEIKNLTMSFKKKEILHDISVTFERGTYGVLGPNGAGKTTLIRCLTGVYPIASDTIFKSGHDITKLKTYGETLGYLPQKFGLFKGMTSVEMMYYFSEMKKIPKEKQKHMVEECLEAVGMEERADDKVRTLSGGMIRRLGIAQALLGNPQVIILDEPTAGLDPEERIRFKNIISKISKDKLIILSTHIVEDVAALCDQVIILADGRIKEIGTGEEIASLADGCVYSVPLEQEDGLEEPYFICQQGEQSLRVLSAKRQPGELQKPTIEDGYICKVRGLCK